MNELEVFNNDQFGQVRTLLIDNDPWFVGKDVALALGYTNPQEAIRNHVDNEDKGVSEILTPGGKQKAPIINESGLYSLILSSKLPKAKEFKHWITSEVLPSVRKHGGYIAGQNEMSNEELLAKALLLTKKIVEEKEAAIAKLDKKIQEDKPLVEFAKQASDITGLINVGEMAKLAHGEDIKLGRNKLFCWLRANKILRENNQPYQQFIDRGLFAMKESVSTAGRILTTTYITGKGQLFLIKKLKKEFVTG